MFWGATCRSLILVSFGAWDCRSSMKGYLPYWSVDIGASNRTRGVVQGLVAKLGAPGISSRRSLLGNSWSCLLFIGHRWAGLD